MAELFLGDEVGHKFLEACAAFTLLLISGMRFQGGFTACGCDQSSRSPWKPAVDEWDAVGAVVEWNAVPWCHGGSAWLFSFVFIWPFARQPVAKTQKEKIVKLFILKGCVFYCH